jgi:hypothetical protein
VRIHLSSESLLAQRIALLLFPVFHLHDDKCGKKCQQGQNGQRESDAEECCLVEVRLNEDGYLP